MFRSLVLPVLLSASGVHVALSAADVTDTEEVPPWVLSIPSGAALTTAWDDSLYGRLWRDPALNDVRELALTWCSEVEKRSGIAPLTLWQKTRRVTAQVSGLERDADGLVVPQGVLAVDLGQDSASVHETLTDRMPDLATALLGDVLLLRFNSDAAVVAASAPANDTPATVAHATFDMDMVFSLLLAVAPLAQHAGFITLQESFTYYRGTTEYDLHLVTTGTEEFVRFPRAPQAPRPLDRTLLARLPDHTLLMFAQGVNGTELWQSERESFLRDMQEDYSTEGIDETETAINEMLAEFGAHHGIAELFAGLDGTIVATMTPGAPLPGFSLIVPRSAALDDLIQAAGTTLDIVVPLEGVTSQVTIPGVPLPLQLTRDHAFWVLTTDSGLALTWGDGQPGGWAESAAGKVALAKARPEAFLLAASDTPAVLRLLANWAAKRMKAMKELDPVIKRAVVKGLVAAGALAGTGYLVGYGEKRGDVDTTVLEAHGVLGFGFYSALTSYLALKPSTNAAADNETAAVAVLRDQIWPNAQEFHEVGHLDQDGDGTGEYGLLPELAGRPLVDGSTVTLLPLHFADPAVVLRGYHFALYLPDGKGGVVSAEADPRTVRSSFGAAQAQAQHYVAYAWPDRPEHGGRMFALTQEGDLYVAPFTGEAPSWNALFGGPDMGWDAEAAWDVYEE